MNESLVTYGIWFIPVLYMLCFGMLAYALIGGLHEAADSYQSVYAEQASRELEDLFMFIPAKRIADLARVAAVTMFLTIFMVGGDFASPGGMFRGAYTSSRRDKSLPHAPHTNESTPRRAPA